MKPLRVERVALRVNGSALFAPLDFSVAPGSVTSVAGPSGAGKSSLLAFLCGVLPRAITATGRVSVGDDDVTDRAPDARRFGILFQDALLFPHLSVAGNLLFGLRRGGSRAERQARIERALASVALDGFGGRDPATLSGGQKTRVALLRVMLSEPRALLLDEPFSALDEANRVRARELVFAEAKRRELPTLLVSHDDDDIRAAGGPVIELGTPTDP